MPPQLRAVIFDLDGLMFNTEELYEQVGEEILRRRGKEFTADLLDRMMGRPAPHALQMMIDWHGLEDTVDGIAAESEALFRAILDDRLELMPGLDELLMALESAQIPKGIATGSGRAFAADILGRFAMEPRFAFVLTAEDVSQGKPHPEIYQMAAAHVGFSPGEMLVLEDSENGCRAALAAGAFTVAVPSGRSQAHDFRGAAFVADTLADQRIYQALGVPWN